MAQRARVDIVDCWRGFEIIQERDGSSLDAVLAEEVGRSGYRLDVERTERDVKNDISILTFQTGWIVVPLIKPSFQFHQRDPGQKGHWIQRV